MTRKAALFAGLFLSGALAAAAGCGDGTGTTGSGGAGGDPTTSSPSSSSSSSSMSSSSTGMSMSSSSSGAGGGGPALTCDDYCTIIMNATNGCIAGNAQYPSNESCMAACAGFPMGALGDTSGNTLGCRIYHADAANDSATNADTHCPHAGPSGGDGTCGMNCEGFCSVAMAVCTAGNEQWPTEADCMTDCMGYTYDTANPFDVTDTMGDTFNCRLYHLTNAAIDAASAMTHCPHIITGSPVCM